MTYAIYWEERAVTLASGFLAGDPAGLSRLVTAVDLLAGEPRPRASFPYGSEDLRRLRMGQYRVLYEINPAQRMIAILHIGRLV